MIGIFHVLRQTALPFLLDAARPAKARATGLLVRDLPEMVRWRVEQALKELEAIYITEEQPYADKDQRYNNQYFAHYLGEFHAVLRQNLVTIDIVDFLTSNATLYWYEGITILAVLLFECITQRAMQFGSREPCLTATTCHPEANPKAAGNQYIGPPVLGLVIS